MATGAVQRQRMRIGRAVTGARAQAYAFSSLCKPADVKVELEELVDGDALFRVVVFEKEAALAALGVVDLHRVPVVDQLHVVERLVVGLHMQVPRMQTVQDPDAEERYACSSQECERVIKSELMHGYICAY